jgi:vacuolar-type H+-ATPase subunit I/STV1
VKQKNKDTSALVHTYQTRLKNLPEAQQKALDDCANLLSQVKRKLFAQVQSEEEFKGEVLNQTKSSFLSHFGISARHFNSVWSQLRGLIDSYKSNLKRRIADNQERLKNVKKNIDNLVKKEIEPEKQQKHQIKIHHKKRRLAQIENRLKQLQSDEKTGFEV